MKNITSKHSEYIAVRVALGVILLLGLLGVVQPAVMDKTYKTGLANLVTTMKLKFPNATVGMPVPPLVRRQIEIWKNGNGDVNIEDDLVWLDVAHLVYCNALTQGATNCTGHGTAPVYWQSERSLAGYSWDRMNNAIKDATFRRKDMFVYAIPDLSDQDITNEQVNERTLAVAVILDRGRVEKQAVLSILTTLVVICVIVAGILFLTKDITIMSGNLLKPLRELADDMESLSQLQLAGAEEEEVRDTKKGTDEIRQIRITFEKMKKAIKSWGKYVPWPVVQTLLRANVEADLRVEEVDASMYFSDIAGFTTIVESLPPEKSLLLLNRYFNDMTKVIDDHGGVVIEFIGDAIFCIYGKPLENPIHSMAAVKAALRMLACLKKINSWSKSKGLPEVNIRCGVHTGKVLVGNMGFHSRIKYGIVGEESQLPSRLEEANKTYTSKCLVSSCTFAQLLPEHFLTRPVDFIRLRQAPGSEPEFIHEVLDRDRRGSRSHALWDVMDRHTEAMQLMMQRQFTEAIAIFEEVGDEVKKYNGFESDGPTELLISRCQSYIKDPPPADWDGVWDRAN